MNNVNKIALVTGGGTGIGLAITQAMTASGMQVVITGRRNSVLENAAESAHGEHPVRFRAADLADANQAQELVDWIETEVGPLDVVVNNAGVNVVDRSLDVLSVEDWDTIMRVNANGPFYLTRAVLPAMRRRGHGLFINISSMAGLRGYAISGAAYSASKHALNALTQVLTEEEAKHGIRATIICPGPVNTPILDQRPVPLSEEERQRILQPEDVAAAVMLVVSLPSRAHIPELHITPSG